MRDASDESWIRECQAWRLEAEGVLEGIAADPCAAIEVVEKGIRLRRKACDLATEASEAEVLAPLSSQLFRLQNAVVAELRELRLREGAPLHLQLLGRIEAFLHADRAYLDRVVGRPATDEVRRALLLQRLRTDLQWRDQLLACAAGESPPHPLFHSRAALDEIRQLLEGHVPPNLAAPREEALAGAVDMRRRMLEHRAREELTSTLAGHTPADLWRRRFAASRLQAEIAGLAGEAPSEFVALLAEHRRNIASAVDGMIATGPTSQIVGSWHAIGVAAREHAIELAASVDNVPVPHAVALLESGEQDAIDLQRSAGVASQRLSDDLQSKLRSTIRFFRRLERTARNRLQDKRLDVRQAEILGPKLFRFVEGAMLVLVLLIAILLMIELIMERRNMATPGVRAFFAFADLAICSAFLADFAFRLTLTYDRWRYFRRHCIVDFFAALPLGFIGWLATVGEAAEGLQVVVRLLRLLRLQFIQPLVRVARLCVFAFSFADRLVHRYASAFNRNLVLWEPERSEPAEHHVEQSLGYLRDLQSRRLTECLALLNAEQRVELASRSLRELGRRLDQLPPASEEADAERSLAARELPIERVVDLLVGMTPERLNERMGPGFVESVSRYVRMFDLPLVRRLPGVRELVAMRSRGHGEVAAAAANILGRILQTVVNFGHYLADLHGTISPPIFVDRLGTSMVAATIGPAKRLVSLGLMFLALYLASLINWMPIPQFIADRFTKVLETLTGFVVVLGVLCSIPLALGYWLRRVANRTAERFERIVEAQFLAQTKEAKRKSRREDSLFLAERVVRPELGLRACDDTVAGDAAPESEFIEREQLSDMRRLRAEELGFLHSVELLYQDYLDGSPFHRSDTKTTNQLLGNLALLNLRRRSLEHMHYEEAKLGTLDLNRAGGIFGGPYLWFNYINRMLTQETARLLLDYNEHAIPLDTLSSAPKASRNAYRTWLGCRLNRAPESIPLPPPIGEFGDCDPPDEPPPTKGPPFLETVDFTALDFLADDPRRDAEIRRRYGDLVADLLRQDRREVVRKAFRTFPLHRIPKDRRTINLYAMYERYVAGGRVALLPLRFLMLIGRLLSYSIRTAIRVIREMLHPEIVEVRAQEPDTYQVAMRKVHRMRKPVFMRSLWLRARFDAEYIGAALPGVPFVGPTESLMERDLDFIGASHFERISAEKLRKERVEQLRWIGKVLPEIGLDFEGLRTLLPRDFPHVAERRAEVVRAIVAAAVIDHDDIFSLGCAVVGLREMMAAAATPSQSLELPPPDLPPTIESDKPLWRTPRRDWLRPLTWRRRLFSLPCFPSYELWQQERIRQYFHNHRGIVAGWLKVLLDQGGHDPVATLRYRLCDVVRRTDLWSDQILALRTIQTLTMLDVHHYCRTVWNLGEYEQLRDETTSRGLPFLRPQAECAAEPQEERLILTALEH